MRHLITIERQKGINYSGTRLHRRAYRAIINEGSKLLMVQSEKYGEIKFPGGGIEHGESIFEALKREVIEETGYEIEEEILPFGTSKEYAIDFEGIYDVFEQDSTYYICKIKGKFQEAMPQGYEIEYGYHPIWVTIEDAIKQNNKVQSNDLIPWKERDTYILEILEKEGVL